MPNEFIKFIKFIEDTTGRYHVFADFFEDIFIYIPEDKIPPKIKNTYYSESNTSLQNYFTAWNNDFYNLVYNYYWKLLENDLGYELLRFCLADCIFAKRTKGDAFMVSGLLKSRSKYLVKPSKKLNKIFYSVATCGKENQHNIALPNDNKLHKQKEIQKNLSHIFCASDIEISTDHILFKISRSSKVPDSRTSEKKYNKTIISSEIINMQVGDYKIVGYEDCIEPLEVLLKKLLKAHAKYNYENALNNLIISNAIATDNKKKTENQNFEKQLPIYLLKKYFTNIFNHVIPQGLFGSHKNRNTVIKIICDLLETPQYQSINLKPYILKMRISEMRWLDGIKNSDVQWSVLGKLLKWLFNKYIMGIFHTQLYITVIRSYEKIYFKQVDWQKLTSAFIRKMCKDEVLGKINGIITKTSCHGRWILFPKKNGVRPIMSSVSASKQGGTVKMALCYLQQLYMTRYGNSRNQIFFENWRNLVAKFRDESNKTIYLVCCDIQYAYGTIDQKKLLTIVESLTDSTESQLSLKWYKIFKDLEALKSNRFRLKQYFSYPSLQLPISSKSIFICVSDKIVKVKKEVLLHEVKNNVLKQNISILNQKYLLQKGIAQGATLSSVLCDIYYAHMEETYLSQFKNEGLLCRYVDDFLFATEDKASAERFFELVKKGFPDYNCSFNTAKTMTNLPGYERTTNYITYLGYNINSETLEVTLDYSKSPRYTTILSNPRYKIIEKFNKRLSNLASLKIDGIVMDCKINSMVTVTYNIKCIFMRQAERCLWLLRALFDDMSYKVSEIFKIIQSTNLKIIRRIQRYFLANGYDFESFVPTLLVIPWNAYRRVFGKIPIVYMHFRLLFLKSIKIIQRAVAIYN